MKNFLIFLGIIAVAYLAVIDTMDRYKELEQIAVTTPAQVEMKPDLNKTNGRGIEEKLDNNIQRPEIQKNRTDSIKDQTQTVEHNVIDRTKTLPEEYENPAKGKYAN